MLDMTFIDGTMNACGYTKILADKMILSISLAEEEYASMIMIQNHASVSK